MEHDSVSAIFYPANLIFSLYHTNLYKVKNTIECIARGITETEEVSVYILRYHKWVNGISTSNERVEMVLPFVYTRSEEGDEVRATRAQVEKGIFH
jgi:hypothetical protein